MDALGVSLRHGLGNLATFRGRDTIAQFWPFAATVLGAVMACAQAIAGWRLAAGLSRPEPGLDVGELIGPLAVGAAAAALLLAAAVSRRLHDTNRRGAWGAAPLPFLACSLYLLARPNPTSSRERAQDLDSRFVLLAGNNLVYLCLMALLIWFLTRPGTAGPNRFGEAPPTEASAQRH